MGATQVEQLLREIELDRVTPVRYSRRSFSARMAPVLLLLSLALAVTTTGVVLGHL